MPHNERGREDLGEGKTVYDLHAAVKVSRVNSRASEMLGYKYLEDWTQVFPARVKVLGIHVRVPERAN
ncbi:MAG TPA: hypothetical protein VNS88_00425 [Nitrospiraceae bacterium]|nr:hypothetical protein [Nitrospiraceae bacterium]